MKKGIRIAVRLAAIILFIAVVAVTAKVYHTDVVIPSLSDDILGTAFNGLVFIWVYLPAILAAVDTVFVTFFFVSPKNKTRTKTSFNLMALALSLSILILSYHNVTVRKGVIDESSFIFILTLILIVLRVVYLFKALSVTKKKDVQD